MGGNLLEVRKWTENLWKKTFDPRRLSAPAPAPGYIYVNDHNIQKSTSLKTLYQ